MRFMWFHKLICSKAYQRYMREKREAEQVQDDLIRKFKQEREQRIHKRLEAERMRFRSTPASAPVKRSSYSQRDDPVDLMPWDTTPSWAMPDPAPESSKPAYKGSGGSFDGGGASSNWDSSPSTSSSSSSSYDSGSSSSDSGSSSFSSSSD